MGALFRRVRAAGDARQRRTLLSRSQGAHAAGIVLVLLLADSGTALAFPVLDTTAQDAVPHGTELPSSELQDLAHQLQMANGLSAPTGGGWTIVPRLDLQEGLTDNVMQQHSPRRFDLGTFVAPGIGVVGDTPRLKATFDFAPVLSLYARTGSLNQLTEQMNGLASLALSPDLAYVDVRAVSGVRSQYGGFGGLGTLGSATDSTLAAASGSLSSLAGNTLGVTKDNTVQTSSVGVSPYLVHRFGDWGSGRLGYSLDVTRSDALSGFAAAPFPTGGVNGQSLISNEETAHYETGEIVSRLTDSVDIDLLQRQSHTDNGFLLTNGTPAASNIADQSSRMVFFDTAAYALNRNFAVFASGGHEDISYTGATVVRIHDLTWALGTTVTPDPDSQVTVSYGHRDGFNSLSVEGHYALTARTMLTASYGSNLGTQLETVQTQLNQASVGSLGTLVDARTNAPLFGNINLLPAQDGVFRTTTLALGSRTTLDRDIISFSFLTAEQSNSLAGVQSNVAGAQSKLRATAVGGAWIHQMRPDMTVSAGLWLTWQNPTGYNSSGPGKNTSAVVSVSWQQQVSKTLTASIRYSLLSRQSEFTNYTVFQNVLIFGITKTF